MFFKISVDHLFGNLDCGKVKKSLILDTKICTNRVYPHNDNEVHTFSIFLKLIP